MTRRLARLSPAARRWFLAEVAYLAERNARAAEKFVRQMRAARRTLADFPRMAQTGLIPGTQRLVVGNYVLAVRMRADDVEVFAIRHGRQGDAYAPRE